MPANGCAKVATLELQRDSYSLRFVTSELSPTSRDLQFTTWNAPVQISSTVNSVSKKNWEARRDSSP